MAVNNISCCRRHDPHKEKSLIFFEDYIEDKFRLNPELVPVSVYFHSKRTIDAYIKYSELHDDDGVKEVITDALFATGKSCVFRF